MSEQPISKDDPIYMEWEKYKETNEYKNARKWASYGHVDGSLWASFIEGYRRAQNHFNDNKNVTVRQVKVDAADM